MYSANSTTLVVVVSVLVPLSSVFVALRFKARKSTKAGLGLDDYTILAVQIIQYAAAAKTIFGAVVGGEGDSIIHITEHPSEMATYSKIQYIGILMFTTSIALVKISTLILYKRLFFTKNFHFACHAMMALTAAWFLESIFGEIFSSKPVSKGWTSLDEDHLINYPAFLLATAVINMVLDLIIVCMPLFVVRDLQMSLARKAQVSGIFLMGLFCIFAAAVRIYYLQIISNVIKESDTATAFDTAVINEVMWFNVEPQASTIAACLPTLAPLFHSENHVAFEVRALRSIHSLHTKNNGNVI